MKDPTDSTPTELALVGAGGHAVSVASSAREVGWQVSFLVDSRRAGEREADLPILSTVPDEFVSLGGRIAVAIGDNRVRRSVATRVMERFGTKALATIVDSSASCADSAEIGVGTFVGRGAIVGALAKTGTFCIVNSGAILDHESVIGDFSALGPGATVGGRARIGSDSAVGIGATIRNSITVGDRTLVGAHSYVHADLVSGVIAWGVPAQVKGLWAEGSPYL